MSVTPAPDARETPAKSPAPSAWKREYWHLRRRSERWLADVALQRRLRRLQHLAEHRPPRTPGGVRLGRWRVHYDDARTIYVTYKHIFGWGIYDYRPTRPDPLVIDGGAHIGLSVMRFTELAPRGRIVAFEPDVHARALLERNCAINALRHVQIVPAALGVSAALQVFASDGADGSRATTNAAGANVQTVATAPLRDYLTEPIDFLKLNIEGAETAVLAAAAEHLHHVQQLAIEYHGWPECGQTLHTLLAILHDCGFRYVVHDFDRETNPQLGPPFNITADTRFFALIAAQRIWERRRPIPAKTAQTIAAAKVPAPVSEPGGAAACADVGVEPQTTFATGERQGERSEQCVATLPRCTATATVPVSHCFGLDRGQPVDRYYIARFLNEYRTLIRGRVLEVGETRYTEAFGGQRVTQATVLVPPRSDVSPPAGLSSDVALLKADLSQPDSLPSGVFDCFICTQTLLCVADVQAAVASAARLLVPGGALLVTAPAIAQRSRYDAERWGDYWRFMPQGLQHLLAAHFGDVVVAPATMSPSPTGSIVRSYGNYAAAAALLAGQAAEELDPAALDVADEDYPVVVAAVARKPGPPGGGMSPAHGSP